MQGSSPVASKKFAPLIAMLCMAVALPPGLAHASGAVSASDSTIAVAPFAVATSVSLVPGWNLISLSLTPDDPAPEAVFATVAGSYSRIYAYRNCDAADPWKIYDPADASATDLSTVDPSMGIWLYMTRADTLRLSGAPVSTASVPLCRGWNLIGYPLPSALPVRGALFSIAGQYSLVFGYDSDKQQEDPWVGFEVSLPAYANDLDTMEPNRGYWLYASQDTTLAYAMPGPAPTVSIVSPADGAEITGRATVTGSVSSSAPVSWTLSYRVVDDATWTTIGSGATAVSNGVLGSVDATMLLNDLYQLKLEAVDVFGQTALSTTDILIGGGQKVGPFTLTFLDLDIPLQGIPIRITRTYDSRDKRKGAFGVGWTLDIKRGTYRSNRKPGDGWTIRRSEDFFKIPCSTTEATKPHITEVRLSDGEYYRFALQIVMSGFGSFVSGGCSGMARFTQVGGKPGAKLNILDDDEVYWRSDSDQVTFSPFDPRFGQTYEPSRVQLVTAEGNALELDRKEGLLRAKDVNENTLTITNNGVTHSSGKSITFVRDSQNRIVQIQDPLGGVLEYGYNIAGDLVTVTDTDKYQTRFTYDAQHNMLDIIDARGVRAARNEYDAQGRLIAVIDTNGGRTELGHDLNARRETIRDRLGNITVVEYDARGNVTRKTDALGQVTSYTYDANDNLLTETDPLGRTQRMTYDGNDNVLTLIDFDGNTITRTYTARNQMLTFADDRGRTASNVYDFKGILFQSVDSLGAVTRYNYHSSGLMIGMTDPLGYTSRFTYDFSGNRLSDIDPFGHATTSAYDARNRPTTTSVTRTLPNGSVQTLTQQFQYSGLDEITRTVDALGNEFLVQTNGLGKATTITNANGTAMNFDYNTLGKWDRIRYADGSTQSYTYNAEGQELSSTDRDNHTSQSVYDPLGRRIRTLYADGATTTVGYDAIGRVISETNERGYTTRQAYGAHTHVMTDALGNTTRTELDSDENPVRVTDANSNVTLFAYDLGSSRHGEGRLISTTYPNNTTVRMEYDVVGNKAAQIDQAGLRTQFGHDAVGRLTTVTEAGGQLTRYTYDVLGNLIAITDAKGNTTRMEYDARHRLTRRILPLGQAESFEYDAVGNLIAHTDFNGQRTTYIYDGDHRLIELRLPGGGVETYAYTPGGLRTRAGADTFTYDARDRLLTDTKANGEVLAYTYDAAGNRSSVTTSQGATAYTYDALNRIEAVTDDVGRVTRYTYDAVGNMTRITLPNDVVSVYTYDALSRLSRIETRGGNGTGALLASYTYTRAVAGHVTQVSEGHTGRSVSYTYDALYRLTGETVREPGAAAQTTQYTYDAVGNRLTKHVGQAVTTYTYDANNRLTRESGPSGVITYSYDDNGNLRRKQGPGVDVSYDYDSRDRLIRVNTGTDVVAYDYDTDGNRVRSTVNGTQLVNFVVDRNRPLAQVLVEKDGLSGLMAKYVYGNDLVSMQDAGATVSFYHYDGQMSTRQLSGLSGAVSAAYTYDAFGNLLTSASVSTNRYLYTGEQFDGNASLYYLRARFYDSTIGRFITSDPLNAIVTDDSITLHRYLYARSNPVSYQDPSGQFPSLISFTIGFSILAVLAVGIYSISAYTPSSANIEGFTGLQSIKIDDAWKRAKNIARYMEAGGKVVNFNRWYGIPYGTDFARVMNAWKDIDSKIEFAKFKATDFDCYANNFTTYAKATISDPNLEIRICPEFTTNNVKRDLRALLVIHEFSHLVGAATTPATLEKYEEHEVINLAKTNSFDAIRNGTNYQFHAADVAASVLKMP